MQNINILGTDEYVNALCDWIEECQALQVIWPGYVNDSFDVDMEGCFVYDRQGVVMP